VSLMSPDKKNFTMVIETMVGLFVFSQKQSKHFCIVIVAREM